MNEKQTNELHECVQELHISLCSFADAIREALRQYQDSGCKHGAKQ